MFEAFISGLTQVLSFPAFAFMMLGMGVGFVVGILPGLGGATAIALMLPFIYPMSPVEAVAFLLGMHSVCATTGDITSVLFAIPGEPSCVATILDGHPMVKKGEAGRALGAALFSSLLGAWVGAFTLAAAMPIVRPLVMAFGSPEFFMVVFVGIAFMSSLGGGSMVKAFAAAALGLLISMVGSSPHTGTLRYTLGQLYLWEGVPLIPLVVGLFGIPEVVEMAVKGTSLAEVGPMGKVVGVMEGIKDTIRHWGLVVRCSILGALIGIIPGLGGGVAQFVAYGHAVQSSPDKERFGKGAVEGVLGPGAANNSKEGGALIPTVAFGVPAGATMAILLGAFLIMGLVPGPDMVDPEKHANITFSMVWTLVIANFICVGIALLFLNQIVKITRIKGTILIPFITLLIFLGAYASENNFGDIFSVIVFGLLGWAMVKWDWPRAPLILGVILGHLAENNLYISTARYGATWLGRPIVIILIVISILVIFYPFWQERRRKQKKAA